MARVLLLFGGRSAEHEVSCATAVAVYDALDSGGHQVIPVGIDREGAWYLADVSQRQMHAAGRPATLEIPGGRLRSAGDVIDFDVAFPVLHGPFGEDGTIQGLFEMAGIRYVGCGVLPSAVAMDKDIAKRLFTQAQIPTVAWSVVRQGPFDADPGAEVGRLVKSLGLPVFVKPAELGSSVGVSKATTEAELKEGIQIAIGHGPKVIVEQLVRGREIEVAVLEGPRTSIPGEIVIKSDWYDYDAKYHDDTSRFVAPAELTTPETSQVRELADRAFTALECRGLARVDFFLEERGRGFLLNELNTMPGFTPISGFPKMWEASGMSYDELCNELVQIGLGAV